MEINIDTGSLQEVLENLLNIPSPSGFTDKAVNFVANELKKIKVPYEITERGAIISIH